MDNQPEATIVNTMMESTVPADGPARRVTSIDLPGYTILEKLGQGGMGSVFLAVDQKLGRQVAIKVMSHTALHSKKSMARFASEIQTVAVLKHPHIAQLYSAGEKDDIPYYVMEFVDGPTMDEQIGGAPIEPRTAAELVGILARAIDYCHQQGIVHRDLKPSNILMDGQHPKIADFGLAKAFESESQATQTGEVLGTPAYMAPEQAAGETGAIGPATDIYGLGAMLYYALTGRPPFNAPSSVNMLAQVISDDPIGPRRLQKSIPRDLETICLKCLEKKPTRRYPTAAALADDLQRFLDEKPIQARPVSGWERMIKWVRRRPAVAALLMLMTLAVPAIMAGLIYHSNQLSVALNREKAALAEADRELQRANRLAEQGSELSSWLLGKFGSQLRQLSGSMKARYELTRRIGEYLDRSTPDMPRQARFVRRFGDAYQKLGVSQGAESHSSLGNTSEALPLIDRAIELFDQALEIDPGDVISMNLKINALISRAEIQSVLGKHKEAAESLQRSRALFDAITNDRSSDHRLLRVSLMQAEYSQLHADQKLREASKKLGDLEAAIEQGPEDPLLPEETLHQKIWVLRKQGLVLRESGEAEAAEAALQQAMELAQAPYEADPDNPILLERYAGLLVDMADVKKELGEYQTALELLRQALKLRQQYAAQNPDDAFSRYNLAAVLSRLDSAYLLLDNPVKQFEYSAQAAEMYRELAAEHPDNLAYQRNLVIALNSFAVASDMHQKPARVLELFGESLKLARQLADKPDPAVSELALIAEIEQQMAMSYFKRLMRNYEASGIIDDRDFEQAKTHFENSLETYRKMDQIGALNYLQESNRETVRNGKRLLLETIEKLQNLQAPNQDD